MTKRIVKEQDEVFVLQKIAADPHNIVGYEEGFAVLQGTLLQIRQDGLYKVRLASITDLPSEQATTYFAPEQVFPTLDEANAKWVPLVEPQLPGLCRHPLISGISCH